MVNDPLRAPKQFWAPVFAQCAANVRCRCSPAGREVGLYESLDVLVGAGLIASAPAVGCPMPLGAAREGARLSALLRARDEADPFGAVLDAMAREIWLSQESKGLSLAEAEEHALALAIALDACRPDPEDVRAALGIPGAGPPRKANGAHAIEGRIAADVVERSVRANVLRGDERAQDIAGFLLERMLAHLFADRGLLPSLVPMFHAFAGVATVAIPTHVVVEPGAALITPPPSAPRDTSPPEEPERPANQPPETQIATVACDSPGHFSRVQQRYGLSEAAAQRLTTLVEARGSVAGARPERVEELAAWIAKARAQLLKPSNETAEVQRLNAEAAGALAEADFDRAGAILERVRGSVRESRRRIEVRLKEELASLQRHEAEEAQATAGLAELALARREYDRAAALFQDAAEGVLASDPAAALRFVMRQAEALYRKGQQVGDEAALSQSAKIFALALQQARAAGDKRAAAVAEIGVGKVLFAQAERGGDPAMPLDAVAAFRRALALLTRESDQALWSEVQIEFGSALALVGLREAGTDGVARLQEAAAAYQSGLAALSREATPLRWALTQVKLGGVLVRSGERSNHPRFWLAAATALFNALEVFEAEGAAQHADMTRLSLRQFQHRLPAALGQQPG